MGVTLLDFVIIAKNGHNSFYIGPIGSFYNQVNDTGSCEPLVNIKLYQVHPVKNTNSFREEHILYFPHMVLC
jgi:hypothetical protein